MKKIHLCLDKLNYEIQFSEVNNTETECLT